MANTPKVLGQSAPAAATLTTLYDTPASTNTIVSSVSVCNRSSTATTFRIAVRVADGAIQDEDYIYYDQPIPGNETFIFTIGMTLEATDAVDCYATLATVSFNMFGNEIT